MNNKQTITENKKSFYFQIRLGRTGFTLIEVLITLAIVALISMLAYVGFTGAREKSRDAKRLTAIEQLSKGLELYSQNQVFISFPNGLADWDALETALSPYVANFPHPPLAEDDDYFFYAWDNGATEYILGARLETSNHPALDLANEDDTPRATIQAMEGVVGITGNNGVPVTPGYPTCSDAADVYCIHIIE